MSSGLVSAVKRKTDFSAYNDIGLRLAAKSRPVKSIRRIDFAASLALA